MGLPRKWKMRDGSKIKIKDMSTSHIRNAIAMMERNGWISTDTLNFYLSCGEPQGEQAQYTFWAEQDRILEAPCSSVMTALERELKRRESEKDDRWPLLLNKLNQK